MIDEIELSARLHDLDVTVPVDLVDRVTRRGRRRVLRRRGAGVLGAAMVLAGIGSVGVLTQRGGPPQVHAASVRPAVNRPTTCLHGVLPSHGEGGTRDDLGLEAVCMPHPAPGFPSGRARDSGRGSMSTTSGGYDKGELTRTFLRARTPEKVRRLGDGSSEDTPTGPEATVIVSRKGTFGTSPASVAEAKVYPVIGTTTVDGLPATVVRVDAHQIGVLAHVGGFDIQAYGSNSVGGPTPSVAELTILIESLRNLA